jgi:hypothetical protein
MYVGVLLYEMMTGRTPFHGPNRKVIQSNIISAKFKMKPMSYALQQLIQGLLRKSIPKRLGSKGGADEIKKQPFFKGVDWKLLELRRVAPPFVPGSGVHDLSRFDNKYTSEMPVDSPSTPNSIIGMAGVTNGVAHDPNRSPSPSPFAGFSYTSEPHVGISSVAGGMPSPLLTSTASPHIGSHSSHHLSVVPLRLTQSSPASSPSIRPLHHHHHLPAAGMSSGMPPLHLGHHHSHVVIPTAVRPLSRSNSLSSTIPSAPGVVAVAAATTISSLNSTICSTTNSTISTLSTSQSSSSTTVSASSTYESGSLLSLHRPVPTLVAAAVHGFAVAASSSSLSSSLSLSLSSHSSVGTSASTSVSSIVTTSTIISSTLNRPSGISVSQSSSLSSSTATIAPVLSRLSPPPLGRIREKAERERHAREMEEKEKEAADDNKPKLSTTAISSSLPMTASWSSPLSATTTSAMSSPVSSSSIPASSISPSVGVAVVVATTEVKKPKSLLAHALSNRAKQQPSSTHVITAATAAHASSSLLSSSSSSSSSIGSKSNKGCGVNSMVPHQSSGSTAIAPTSRWASLSGPTTTSSSTTVAPSSSSSSSSSQLPSASVWATGRATSIVSSLSATNRSITAAPTTTIQQQQPSDGNGVDEWHQVQKKAGKRRPNTKV